MKATRFVLLPRPARGGLFRDLLGVGRGLWATAAHMIEKPAVQPTLPANLGSVQLRLAPDGSSRCVACGLCSAVCPPRCLTVLRNAHATPTSPLLSRFEIDELRCISCARCVEICPEDALDMLGAPANATSNRSQGIKVLFPHDRT